MTVSSICNQIKPSDCRTSPNILSRVIRTGLVLLVLFSTCQAAIADAAKPVAAKKNSAISLVGNDVGLCVQFNNLNRHLDNFEQSATYRRLASTTVFKAWQKSADHKILQSAISQIEKITGKPLGKRAKDLFGKSVILAVYPQAEKEPAGVLLQRLDR